MAHTFMGTMFTSRTEAGQALGARLAAYARRSDVVVLALPRGGVPVAREVADALDAPLGLLMVHRLCLPGAMDVPLGAVATGGAVHWNGAGTAAGARDARVRESLLAHAQVDLVRREAAFAGVAPAVDVQGRTVIVVDDGVASGSSLGAALMSLRAAQPAWIVVAVPVAPQDAHERIGTAADEFVCLHTPWSFRSVSEWYHDYPEVTDAEVRRLLTPHAGGSVTN